MSLRVFYAVIMSVLATMVVLSTVWEFWLEDRILAILIADTRSESIAERWEFVVTSVVFSALALIGPTVIGRRVIQRERALHREVVRLSQEDGLTGLLNRRRITQLLDSEVQRASRYDAPFSVIMIDIDQFKPINDRFGHQVGDQVLTMIADAIRSTVRTTDLVGRWGGEEFVVVLPQTGIEGGLALASKMRARLESTDLDEVGRKTGSFGVATFAEGDDVRALIARADAGMYAAKRGGGNRVEVVAGGTTTAPD